MTWMRAYSRKSNAFPSDRAEVGLLRSLRRTEQIRFIAREQKARIRYVHGNPTLSTPAPAPRLYAKPAYTGTRCGDTKDETASFGEPFRENGCSCDVQESHAISET